MACSLRILEAESEYFNLYMSAILCVFVCCFDIRDLVPNCFEELISREMNIVITSDLKPVCDFITNRDIDFTRDDYHYLF